MTRIQQCVHHVRRRQQLQWIWKCLSVGLLGGGVVACLLAILRWQVATEMSIGWVILALAAGPLCGFVVAVCRWYSLQEAAALIDSVCGLKDRTQTALTFILKRNEETLPRLQVKDAERHIGSVDPANVAPLARPRTFPLGVVLACVALVLLAVTGPQTKVDAAPTVNAVVSASAANAEQGLEELREFQEETADPELEELLQDLAEQMEMLKEIGLDPKEALAQFSEMEASLQELEKQLNEANAEAALREVGEALSLSDAMSAAGKAMANGEMEKAAEELAKLEMPKLDRQAELAITEKLDQMQQNDPSQGQKGQKLKEALAQMSAGLSQGNKSKFSEGRDGLASECKKQGQRKKLSDLLRKQCQCLSECKSECEGECKSEAESKKKGGTKAGSARSGNDPGDKTAQLKTNPEMNITGQDSGQGDVDIETEEGSEQHQEAVRRYREKAEKYEAMSESAIDSESIPLGHRQTIRRYFEMIRPQNGEMDQVLEKTENEGS